MRVGYLAGLILLALLACAAGQSRLLSEKQTAWQPSPGHTQLPIWPGVAPDARPVDGPEISGTVVDAGNKVLVGGKPWVYVDKVSQPTMTVVPRPAFFIEIAASIESTKLKPVPSLLILRRN